MTEVFDRTIDLFEDEPTPLELGTLNEDTQISGRGADPTHHVKLVDGEGSSVGFVITDQEGSLDERTFRRFHSSDPQTPYVTERQSSFGGGFGQATFEDNRAKYWKSKGVDTTKDALILGPMFHYARGAHSKAREYMPSASDTAWFINLKGKYAWLAQPFTPDQEWTKAEYLKIWLKKTGTPATLQIKTYTNDGSPNTLINTTTVTAASITHVAGDWVRIDIDDTYTFDADTQYWMVLTTTGTASGFWSVWGHQGSGGKKSTDGSSWTDGVEFYFRVEGNRSKATHKFFEYKKQLYWLSKFDSWRASELWMNGWRGVADSNSGEESKLKDSGTNFSNKIIGGEVVQVYAGPASSEQEDRREVLSGADGSVTVDRDWEITHSNKDEYVVTNTDWCFKIDASTHLAGRVSDMDVSRGGLYICKGNNRRAVFYEGYRDKDGNWADRWKVMQVRAQFVRAVNDPVVGDILWFGHNRSVSGSYKPFVWYSQPTNYDGYTLDVVMLSSNSGEGSSWVAAGGAQVAVEEDTGGSVKITVTVGEVTGRSVNAAGTGYSVDDVLTLGGEGDGLCTITVTSVGGEGEVTGISPTTSGSDYDLASGVATTVAPSGGTGCTIDIDTVSSFDGDIAYLDFKDQDGSAETFDLRNMTSMSTELIFGTVRGGPNELAAGEVKLKLSNQVSLGNVISNTSIAGIQAGIKSTLGAATTSLSLANVVGAGEVASLGLHLLTGNNLDRSFYFQLTGLWWANRKRTPIEVGLVDGDNITGIQAYGDPEAAWILTESSFGQIKNNKFMPVPMREIKVARHANNGIANEVSDVYLLFSWKGRLQRYYRQNMEDLGPDFPQGMRDIKGEVVDVVTYPGRQYAAIDGGTGAKSLILCYKGGAWHEVYTSFTGERIRQLYIQPIEGAPDKLWASVGGDVMWFPIILDAAELPANSGYEYRPMGYLDTSWIYTGDRDLRKIFRSLVMTLDQAKATKKKVALYYKVDYEGADWKQVTDQHVTSYSTQKFSIVRGNDPGARGNRVKYRIHMRTNDIVSSHVVRSLLSRIYRLSEVTYVYTWLSKVSTISINLRGDEERVLGTQSTANKAMRKLDHWAEKLTILRIVSDIASVNNRSVVIEPVPFQLLMMVHDEAIQEESIQMSAVEVD